MRVLIIPEDPTLDRHVLKPIIQRVFDDLEIHARIDVLTDPHISGASRALDATMIEGIVQDNRMIDLFLLIVDRDCDRAGHEAKAAARQSEWPDRLIAALAWQEVEVWALALHRQRLGASWSTIRADCDPKETWFDPFISRMGWGETVGRGRKRAMRELGPGWRGLLQVCPEIEALLGAIRDWKKSREGGSRAPI